jgi:hypothetical protein
MLSKYVQDAKKGECGTAGANVRLVDEEFQ